MKDIFGQTLTLLLYLRLNLAVHQSWSSMNALFTFNSRNVSIGLKKTVNTYFTHDIFPFITLLIFSF